MNRRHILTGLAAAFAAPSSAFATEALFGRAPKPICGATALCEDGVPIAGPAAPETVAAPSAAGRALYVDLDRAMLYATEGGALAFTSRVIVGAARTPTPETDSVLDHVRFRPTWRPTPRMVREGLYEDGLRPAGPRNPLGLAAVRFRDGGMVYLHGTNKPSLFNNERRRLSSGCVRVEALETLVAWALGWTAEDTLAAMHGRRTFDADALPIPLRMTARADDPAMAALAGLAASAA